MITSGYWDMIHAERARLANALDSLSEAEWSAATLCSSWSVEEVVAHLSAAANTGTLAWIRSIVRAGFNADKHNDRLLRHYLGDTPGDTLEIFRDSLSKTIAPTRDYGAWLGEVIVHGQDIARPRALEVAPDPAAVEGVARYFAVKDFAVQSRTLVSGLSLQATDSSFRSGSGPVVRGRLLDLVMAMAGRPQGGEALDGDGVAELRRRLV